MLPRQRTQKGAFHESHEDYRLSMPELFDIIYEDPELLVINKPAGLVAHPTKTGPLSSLIGRVRLHLGANAHPHLINRLDRETSGITLVAKSDQAARELRRLWEQRQVEKEYLALVHGPLLNPHGVINAPLGKDERSRVAIKDCVRPDGAPASTEYYVLSSGPHSLLRVWPKTGRKHQIRIHLAFIGHPIVGDKLYGGDEDLYLALVENRLTPQQRQRLILSHHALHAHRLSLFWRDRPWTFCAQFAPWLSPLLTEDLGPPGPVPINCAYDP
jgi:23S rRNA pseudouridine1911/1915/1917 synthase